MRPFKLNDEMLKEYLKRIEDQDSFAIEELYTCYFPLVYRVRGKYFLKEFDLDDWVQLGRIVFYKTVDTFDQENGASLGKYYAVNLERAVVDEIRRSNAQKRKVVQAVLPVEEIEERMTELYANDSSQIEEAYIVKEVFNEYLGGLTVFELETLANHCNGLPILEIAKKLNCNPQKIYRTIQNCREKLKKALE